MADARIIKTRISVRIRNWFAGFFRDLLNFASDPEYRQDKQESWGLPHRKETNFVFIACLVLLCVFGMIMVTSSSIYSAYNGGDSLFYTRKQAIALAAGLFGALAALYFPLRAYQTLAPLAYIGAIILQIGVLFLGEEINGSRRWYDLGFFSFQPSEFTKIATAMFMAWLVNRYRDRITHPGTFMQIIVILLIPTVLILKENLSTAVINFSIGLMILYAGGAKIRHIVALVAFGGLAVTFILVLPLIIQIDQAPRFLQPILNEFYYRTLRIQAWLDPFKYSDNIGYQTVQSLYAIASGGFFGKGLGKSIQKLGYIPEAHNDIIFSVICEELGILGALVVILLFVGLIVNGIRIASYAPNFFTRCLASGLIAQVAVQAIINIAVNVNLIPVTGVTLPFISYGGSSLVFLLVSMGILLNISRYSVATAKQ